MKKNRSAGIILCLLTIIVASGCGGGTFFVSFGPDGGNILFISGFCTSVQVGNIPGPNGGFITITAVTLFDHGFNQSLNFCGNIPTMFPVNSTLEVRYTTGTSCATPVSIAVH